MTFEEIVAKLRTTKKGCYINLKKSKDLGQGITKVSNMVVRLGINYYYISTNTTKEPQTLAWGNYIEGLENYIIEYTNKKGEYNLYLRAYDNAANIRNKTTYFINGIEATKEQVLALVDEKKIASKKSDCYNINLKDIISLGR